MTFKLTYATMFDPPEELHARFDAAMKRVTGGLGRSHPLYIAGADRTTSGMLDKHNPADREQLLGRFAAAGSADAEAALAAAHGAFPEWKRLAAPSRAQLLRRVGELIAERVYDIAASLTLEVGKNRMEALGEAQQAADFFQTYCDDFERHGGFAHALPDDPLKSHVSHNRSVLKPYGAWVVITPLIFPLHSPQVPSRRHSSPATPWCSKARR